MDGIAVTGGGGKRLGRHGRNTLLRNGGSGPGGAHHGRESRALGIGIARFLPTEHTDPHAIIHVGTSRRNLSVPQQEVGAVRVLEEQVAEPSTAAQPFGHHGFQLRLRHPEQVQIIGFRMHHFSLNPI